MAAMMAIEKAMFVATGKDKKSQGALKLGLDLVAQRILPRHPAHTPLARQICISLQRCDADATNSEAGANHAWVVKPIAASGTWGRRVRHHRTGADHPYKLKNPERRP